MSKYNCELNLKDRNSLSVLLTRVKQNSLVLEFGPANGRMTKYMKEQLNCKVYAVEIDENAAKDTVKYTEKIIVDSIENYSWQEEFKGLVFDYIIFADVLEHLYNPEEVLNSVRNFLKDDGSILVSIPNIAHNSIIIGLLKNEFNYNATGLLDNTHIRFFTKKTFDELIKKVGYFTSYETAIFINPSNTEFQNNYNELIPEISDYLQELPCGEIYQLIYELKKNEVSKKSDFSDKYKVYSVNFIQLFISYSANFLEENSVKYPVIHNNEIQKFEFDLEDLENIGSLRLDPLNDSCVIEIENLYLLLKNEEKFDLMPYLSANSCLVDGKIYFFEFFDPNIYFENLDFREFDSINKLCIELKYKHIAKDAVHVCANQIVIDKNYKISNLEKEKVKLQENLNSLENKTSNLEKEKVKLQENLSSLEYKTSNLEKEKSELQENLSSLGNRAVNLENELLDIYTSKSWKFTRRLRNLAKGKL